MPRPCRHRRPGGEGAIHVLQVGSQHVDVAVAVLVGRHRGAHAIVLGGIGLLAETLRHRAAAHAAHVEDVVQLPVAAVLGTVEVAVVVVEDLRLVGVAARLVHQPAAGIDQQRRAAAHQREAALVEELVPGGGVVGVGAGAERHPAGGGGPVRACRDGVHARREIGQRQGAQRRLRRIRIDRQELQPGRRITVPAGGLVDRREVLVEHRDLGRLPVAQRTDDLLEHADRGRARRRRGGIAVGVVVVTVVEVDQRRPGEMHRVVGTVHREGIRRAGMQQVLPGGGLHFARGQAHVEDAQRRVVAVTLRPAATEHVQAIVRLHPRAELVAQPVGPLRRRAGIFAVGGQRDHRLGVEVTGVVVADGIAIVGKRSTPAGLFPRGDPRVRGGVDLRALGRGQQVVDPVIAQAVTHAVEADAVTAVGARVPAVAARVGHRHLHQDVDRLGAVGCRGRRIAGLQHLVAHAFGQQRRQIGFALVARAEVRLVGVLVAGGIRHRAADVGIAGGFQRRPLRRVRRRALAQRGQRGGVQKQPWMRRQRHGLRSHRHSAERSRPRRALHRGGIAADRPGQPGWHADRMPCSGAAGGGTGGRHQRLHTDNATDNAGDRTGRRFGRGRAGARRVRRRRHRCSIDPGRASARRRRDGGGDPGVSGISELLRGKRRRPGGGRRQPGWRRRGGHRTVGQRSRFVIARQQQRYRSEQQHQHHAATEQRGTRALRAQ